MNSDHKLIKSIRNKIIWKKIIFAKDDKGNMVVSISPIVTYFPAPALNISRYLINKIMKYCTFDFTFSLKHSYDLIKLLQITLKLITLPLNSKDISFDVTIFF